jgi:hypothetical protein
MTMLSQSAKVHETSMEQKHGSKYSRGSINRVCSDSSDSVNSANTVLLITLVITFKVVVRIRICLGNITTTKY